jgi:hypothetical protein
MSMKRSWLIQRMQKPTGKVNPFSFGGGGSGFHPDVSDQLKDVCSWDYMGAAEYEFGSTAKAFNRMILAKKKLKAGLFKVPYKYDRRAWGSDPAKQFEGDGKVFYICPKKAIKEIQTRIAKWAIDYEYGDTRDQVKLDEALANDTGPYRPSCCGWFDIDNDFMFFTDEKMWREFCDGLSVKVPSKSK